MLGTRNPVCCTLESAWDLVLLLEDLHSVILERLTSPLVFAQGLGATSGAVRLSCHRSLSSWRSFTPLNVHLLFRFKLSLVFGKLLMERFSTSHSLLSEYLLSVLLHLGLSLIAVLLLILTPEHELLMSF